MIQTVLNILVNELSDYIKLVGKNVGEYPVITGNIGMSDGVGGNEQYTKGKIVLSLVNIMEEPTLKNSSPYIRYNDRHETENPPMFLNLFLLFSANYPHTSNNPVDNTYLKAITRLSQLIEFFQSKNVFTIQNSPLPESEYDPELQAFRVNMELYSLSFEQVNHLWGSLGGKQVPFVMYKAGILPLKRDLTTDRGAYIQDIHSNTDHINQQ